MNKVNLKELRAKAKIGQVPYSECNETVLTLIECIEKMREALPLALSFCPKGPVPEGLSPTFYHTLNYNDEVALQKRIDEARAVLAFVEERLSCDSRFLGQ